MMARFLWYLDPLLSPLKMLSKLDPPLAKLSGSAPVTITITYHLSFSRSKDPYQVVLGEHSLNTPSQNEQYIEIDDWLIVSSF